MLNSKSNTNNIISFSGKSIIIISRRSTQSMVTKQKQEDLDPTSPLYKINPHSLKIIQGSMINVALSSIMFGYSMVNFNAINFDDLMKIFELPMDRSFCQGLFTSCIYIGACFGALTSFYLLKLIARKNIFYVLNFICSIGILLIQTRTVWFIILGRIIQGAFIGLGSSIVPTYIKQFIPQLNGKYGLYNGLGFSVGVVLAFVLNLLLHLYLGETQNYWRYLFCLPIIICLYQSYQIRTNYQFQTPRYLISQQRDYQALQMLKLFYKQQFVQSEYVMLKQAIKNKNILEVKAPSQHHMQINDDYQQILTPRRSRQSKKSKCNYQGNTTQIMIELKTKQNRDKNYNSSLSSDSSLKDPLILPKNQDKQRFNFLPIFCALHLSFEQQIIGVGAVIVYSGEIVKQMIPGIFFVYPIVVNLFGIVGALIGIKIIHSRGRVSLIQNGGIIIFICLIINGVNFLRQQNGNKFVILLCMIIMRTTLSCTLGPIVWSYMAEIVRPHIISYAVVVNYGGATLVMFLFPIIKEKLKNPGWIFIFNGLMCLLSIGINYVTLIETKDKNEVIIRNDFNQKWLFLKSKFNSIFNKSS